jgi:hypothetical protein
MVVFVKSLQVRILIEFNRTSFHLSICLKYFLYSILLFLYLSVYSSLTVLSLSVSVFFGLYLCLSVSVNLSLSLCLYLLCLSLGFLDFLSLCLSVSLSLCLSVSLSLVIPNYSILKYSIARIFFFKYPGYPGDSNSPKKTHN